MSGVQSCALPISCIHVNMKEEELKSANSSTQDPTDAGLFLFKITIGSTIVLLKGLKYNRDKLKNTEGIKPLEAYISRSVIQQNEAEEKKIDRT